MPKQTDHDLETVAFANAIPEDDTHTQENAATIIQSSYRRHAAQQKYRIEFIKKSELADYRAFAVGNDPFINVRHYRSKNNATIALVATSCLRAVMIACELCNYPTSATPKIIIIDNSFQVYRFWIGIKMIFNSSTPLTIDAKLHQFCMDKSYLFRFSDHSHLDYFDKLGLKHFIMQLINNYDYHFIRQCILNTSVIRQSWTTPGLFKKIRHLLERLGISNIYVYASNLLDYIEKEDHRNQMLINIDELNPQMAIHVIVGKFTRTLDGKLCRGQDDRVYCVTDHTPASVIQTVFHPAKPESFDLFNCLFTLFKPHDDAKAPVDPYDYPHILK